MEWMIGAMAAAFWVGAAVWFFRHLRSERNGAEPGRWRGVRVLGGAAPWDAYGGPVAQAPPLVPESDSNNEIR